MEAIHYKGASLFLGKKAVQLLFCDSRAWRAATTLRTTTYNNGIMSDKSDKNE